MTEWEEIFGSGKSAESVISGLSEWTQDDEDRRKEFFRLASKSDEELPPGCRYYARIFPTNDNDLLISCASLAAAMAWEVANPDLGFTRRPGTDGSYWIEILAPPPPTPFDEMGSD